MMHFIYKRQKKPVFLPGVVGADPMRLEHGPDNLVRGLPSEPQQQQQQEQEQQQQQQQEQQQQQQQREQSTEAGQSRANAYCEEGV